jgi:hypothetical protein
LFYSCFILVYGRAFTFTVWICCAACLVLLIRNRCLIYESFFEVICENGTYELEKCMQHSGHWNLWRSEPVTNTSTRHFHMSLFSNSLIIFIKEITLIRSPKREVFRAHKVLPMVPLLYPVFEVT